MIVGGGFLRGGVTVANRIVLLLTGEIIGTTFCGVTIIGFSGVLIKFSTAFFSSTTIFFSSGAFALVFCDDSGTSTCTDDDFSIIGAGAAGVDLTVLSGDFSKGFVGVVADDGCGCVFIGALGDEVVVFDDGTEFLMGAVDTAGKIGFAGLGSDTTLLLPDAVIVTFEGGRGGATVTWMGSCCVVKGNCDGNCCWKFCN